MNGRYLVDLVTYSQMFKCNRMIFHPIQFSSMVTMDTIGYERVASAYLDLYQLCTSSGSRCFDGLWLENFGENGPTKFIR